MANCQYKATSGGAWQDVPDLALPQNDGGSVTVVSPEPTDNDGSGNPCGVFGTPRIEIKAKSMLAGTSAATGVRWWTAFFADETAQTATIWGLKAYNPRRGAWVGYSGTMRRPRVGNWVHGIGQMMADDVLIVVDHLTEVV